MCVCCYRRMAAVSSISDIKVDTPLTWLSPAPTLARTLSITLSSAFSHGTKQPICAIRAITPTWRMNVDLPPIFGPVETRVMCDHCHGPSFSELRGKASEKVWRLRKLQCLQITTWPLGLKQNSHTQGTTQKEILLCLYWRNGWKGDWEVSFYSWKGDNTKKSPLFTPISFDVFLNRLAMKVFHMSLWKCDIWSHL